jgi:hypothetical protein
LAAWLMGSVIVAGLFTVILGTGTAWSEECQSREPRPGQTPAFATVVDILRAAVMVSDAETNSLEEGDSPGRWLLALADVGAAYDCAAGIVGRYSPSLRDWYNAMAAQGRQAAAYARGNQSPLALANYTMRVGQWRKETLKALHQNSDRVATLAVLPGSNGRLRITARERTAIRDSFGRLPPRLLEFYTRLRDAVADSRVPALDER